MYTFKGKEKRLHKKSGAVVHVHRILAANCMYYFRQNSSPVKGIHVRNMIFTPKMAISWEHREYQVVEQGDSKVSRSDPVTGCNILNRICHIYHVYRNDFTINN